MKRGDNFLHHQFFCLKVTSIDQGNIEFFGQSGVMILNIASHQDIGPLAMSSVQKACTAAATKSYFMHLPAAGAV
mgnify:CR=1 FL=1